MGLRGLIVILSLVGCSRGESPAVPTAEPPGPAAGAHAEEPPSRPNEERPTHRPERRPLHLLERHGTSDGPIPYRVVEPSDAGPTTPLVIALHGRGDTARGFARLAMRLELDARILVAEAPMPFGHSGGRQWFDSAAPDGAASVRARIAQLAELIGELEARYPEAGRPGLYGFSQGGVLALQAAHEIPDRLAGVAALSGYLATDEGGVEPTRPLPVLITAGTKDGVIPQHRSWEAAEALAKQGLAVERFAFKGRHDVPPVVVERVRAFFERVLATSGRRR